MVKLYDSGVYLVGDKLICDPKELETVTGKSADPAVARRGTIAYDILKSHNVGEDMQNLRLRYDSMTSHDITYVGIIQTARASGMTSFPIPYVLTNCHNSLCAVGGTINEDDHMFAHSAARRYGGIYVPTNVAVIHSYNREMMAGCGRMILGSDSHTRYGALGTLAVGEGGGELAKQLVGRTYDIAMPQVVAVYLDGKPQLGVGPQDVALSIIGRVYQNGYVKNKVMEFVGPGVNSLPIEYRNGIDVMTTETTCWSSIWETDSQTKEYLELHGRPEAYRELHPDKVAYYDGCIYVDLSKVECTIAMPMHPSYTYTLRELRENAADILHTVEQRANEQLGDRVKMNLSQKLRGGEIWVDQGIIGGCSGGTFDSLCAATDILEGNSCGSGEFTMSVYPGSLPTYLELARNGAIAKLTAAGVIVRECFCGPCFGAGDTPANGEFSIRHATRNFPNREGSKPGDGQLAAVALMDARSIAATAINGGRLTAATDIDAHYTNPKYYFDKGVYQKRVLDAAGKPDSTVELRMGPNIKDWPTLPPLSPDLLVKITSYITDPVTTTDELIPSGETSSYRSNPLRLAEFTLSRKDPEYVERCKAVRDIETVRVAGGTLPDEVQGVYKALAGVCSGLDPASTVIGSTIFANKPGDGSAREQAASCQRVLGAAANIAVEYATKRYRSNCINWGMAPLLTDTPELLALGDWVFIPGLRAAIVAGTPAIDGYCVRDGKAVAIRFAVGDMTQDERQIIADGCLINYYKNSDNS